MVYEINMTYSVDTVYTALKSDFTRFAWIHRIHPSPSSLHKTEAVESLNTSDYPQLCKRQRATYLKLKRKLKKMN